MDALETVVQIVGPAAASVGVDAREGIRQTAKRPVQEREFFRALSSVVRNYNGAARDRMTNAWRPSGASPDSLIALDGRALRDRASDLIINNGYARSIVNAITANTVSGGFFPVMHSITDREQQKLIRAAWFHWCQREADITGHQTFDDMLVLGMKELIRSGEFLIRWVYLDIDEMFAMRRRCPLTLQFIESERLPYDQQLLVPQTTNPDTGNEIRNGVEVDRLTGRPVTYWLLNRHPNDLGLDSFAKPVPVDARRIQHVFLRERIGQTRGVTWLAPAIVWLHRLGTYTDNEMMASALSACVMLLLKSSDPDTPWGIDGDDGDGNTDSAGNTLTHFEPGMVARVGQNDEVTPFNPMRPNSQAEPWLDFMTRSTGTAVDLGYEEFTRDHGKTNFSGQRAGELESRRRYRQPIDLVINQVVTPTYERWFQAAVAAGIQGLPTSEAYVSEWDQWHDITWLPPMREWVDPVKEQMAADAALQSNTRSLASICAERREDWQDVMEQRAQEKAYAKELSAKYGVEVDSVVDLETKAKLTAANSKADAEDEADAAEKN